MTRPMRWILLGFSGLALTAGLLLFAGADDTDDWFSWTIQPPLTAASLGAYYWAAFVLLLGSAEGRDWAPVRMIAYPITVTAAVLLVVTLIHLDKFDLDSLFGVFWLGAYIAAPPLMVWGIALEERRTAGEREGPEARRGALRPLRQGSLPDGLRLALAVEAGLMLGASALLLLWPNGAMDLWPWTLTPLTSAVIGAFVLNIGLVGVLALRLDDLHALRGPARAYLALGALQLFAVALHTPDLGDDEIATSVYIAVWAAVLATGLYALIAARAFSPS